MHYLEKAFPDQLIDVGGQHSSAVELRALWRDKWDEYHTFGFIRNPWEWLVSMYNANLSNGAWEKEALPGGKFVSAMRKSNMPFDEWLKERETTPMDWLSDHNGNVIVDEVRLFEDFVRGANIKLSYKDHPHYRDWYTPELIDYVAEKCKREIKTGNYHF